MSLLSPVKADVQFLSVACFLCTTSKQETECHHQDIYGSEDSSVLALFSRRKFSAGLWAVNVRTLVP